MTAFVDFLLGKAAPFIGAMAAIVLVVGVVARLFFFREARKPAPVEAGKEDASAPKIS